jgi:transposase-like protein
MTKPLSFKRYRYPSDVIRHAVWLYFRFTLSLRDVEELLAQRGIEVSRERSDAGSTILARWLRRISDVAGARQRADGISMRSS